MHVPNHVSMHLRMCTYLSVLPACAHLEPQLVLWQIAKAYEEGGAACLSVLTDRKYFQGSFEYLQDIRNAGVTCPLLCKEFIVEVVAPLVILHGKLYQCK